jgi:PPE-repeat protein
MDFGGLPPEVNSARMYAGPGAESMLAAASAWDGLAAELRSTASSYGSAISALTDDAWVGPSSAAMEDAATPYVAWLNGAAAEAEQTAAQAKAAASAYQAAYASVVPPEVIAINRLQVAQLMATNIYGQNTPAISTLEAQYGEMWAQDASAMYGYAGNSAAASRLTAFTPPPSTTNPAAATNQASAVAQAAGTSTGAGVQSTLSQLMSAIQAALQGLGSPGSAASSGSGLSSLLSDLLGTGTSTGTSVTSTGLGGILSSSGFSLGGLAESLIAEYADLAGFAVVFVGLDALIPLLDAYAAPLNSAAMAAVTPVAAAAAPAAAAAGGAVAATGALGSGFAGLGGLAGLGGAASVGALSVPPSWGVAATPALIGGMPMAAALPGLPSPAGGLPLGLPVLPGGLGQAAGVAAVAGVGGAVASKYGPRLRVLTRSPEAGYSPAPMAPAGTYAAPPGVPSPPGYTPAIVYLPTNGNGNGNGNGHH